MTDSDLGPGSADRHEQRMKKWSREWIESAAWELAEPDGGDMETADETGNEYPREEGADE